MPENIMKPISDQAARSRALNPETSFIVQAPAGSGKTELLTQRFLGLLSTVKSAEEIIAITFTQKAASEMRERVIGALHLANTEPEPTQEHKKTTWNLADKALKQSHKNAWHLLENPSRLRILTIDSLALQLTSCAPLLSEMGCQPSITEDATPLYRAAIENLLKQTKKDQRLQHSLTNLLLHIDNRVEYFIELCCFMLGKREQWLPTIFNLDQDESILKAYLEQGLEQITARALEKLQSLIDKSLRTELHLIIRTIKDQLYNTGHPLENILLLTPEPGIDANEATAWQTIANLLLTKEGKWRKVFTIKQGCPPKSEQKKHLTSLVASLAEEQELQQALQALQSLPPTYYTDNQWQVLQDLLVILPYLVACLRMEMQQRGQIDFTEISLCALRALGDSEQPTDLALYLDYQIQHLLIDEFQDTSTMQFLLFSQLISQWQPDEGKTVFLVGDPMQSIYRFRNAEVGLFLRAQQQGIANISLEFLELQQNFRSSPKIVAWINQSFAAIMPSSVDIATGAVPYSPAIAAQEISGNIHYYTATDSTQCCANKIAALIQSLPNTESIAILVRSRSQLVNIIPALQTNNIEYNALDIQSLTECSEIQDCLSITKAYLHFDDNIAWLALLRAPFVGLTLADLHVVSQMQPTATVWQRIQIAIETNVVSNDGIMRLKQFQQAFNKAISQTGRLTITAAIENLWQDLQANRLLLKTQQENTERFFQLLLELENSVEGLTLERLNNRIQKLYASNTNESNTHIMTIHKSKGLEFDHVILPQLEKKPANNSTQLLQWLEQPDQEDQYNLILAPIKSQQPQSDAIYDYCRSVESKKLQLESTRLMYVACTRVKQSLHLFCNLAKDDTGGILPPAKNSMLSKLWPVHQNNFIDNTLAVEQSQPDDIQGHHPDQGLKRIISSELRTIILENNTVKNNKPFKIIDPEKTETARINGTLIHNELQLIAESGLQHWDKEKLLQQQPRLLHQLQEHGVLEVAQQQASLDIIISALEKTLNNERGSWCLNQNHTLAVSEYPITYNQNGTIEHLILDRFIISQGVSWIIDFKTSQPGEQSKADFLDDQKQRYSAQLAKYSAAIHKIYPNPVKCALFFPLYECHWLEMSFD
jgi:ATP-dependent helicase/nuclease subunit A